MSEVPIDKLLDKTRSIYKLVILASKRAIELADGAHQLVEDPIGTKPAHVALDEILTGKVEYKVKEEK
jgi:DNA-directed RNA polymerase omega subunit